MMLKIMTQLVQRKPICKYCLILNPKEANGVGRIHTWQTIDYIAPYLGIRSGPLISLKSSRSIPVILPPF